MTSQSAAGNILIPSAGRRGELVGLLRKLGLGQVFASDMTRTAPTLYLADAGFVTGPVNGERYVDELLDICVANDVRYIVPAIDPELGILARARSRFAAIGVQVFVSSEASVQRCFDKLETWQHLSAGSVPTVPTQEWTGDLDVDALAFPVVVKPATGSSAKGVRVVAVAADLGSRPDGQKYVVQPFVTGSEVTIDVVMTDGDVAAIGARRREKVRGGEVERGVTVPGRDYVQLAQDVGRCIELEGPFNFQVFHSPGGPLVSDINPRVGGGLPLTEEAGGRILEAMFGLVDLAARPAIADSDIWMMRCDTSVFVHQSELFQ